MRTVVYGILLLLMSFQLTLAGSAQTKIQVLVLGTSHYNEAKDSAEQRRVIEKLKRFNPDMVMGEFVLPQEYLQLEPESYRRKSNDEMFAYYSSLHQGIKSSDRTIAKLKKNIERFSPRIDLAVQYLKKYDIANAQYQVYLLEKYKTHRLTEKEQEHYLKLLGTTDTLESKRLYIPTSEYYTILFPLMEEAGLSEIYSMDCQQYDVKWTNAWRIVAYCMHFIQRIAKIDTTSPEAKIVQKYNEEQQKIYAAAKKENLRGYDYENSFWNAEESDLLNFYGGEKLFGFSDYYPEKEVREMIRFWRLRNEGMAKNIIDQARKAKVKRVIAAAGSAHQRWIEDILRNEADVEIIQFRDL